ncbi:Peptidoglycan-binding domain 1 [Trichormus variabilis ATCC 29413]|uniref:Peptidoglycan-binding domain 1 n=3 Tax=Nostocaceae TaxID=1162 RepID=Q3M526_TRIV2|nr:MULTISPECIES: peptidoglycan-binding domain-containing protein [Nostocaceae]ABA23910.1 Peptidoglycan-binding domain 1 [Trichormus variabilis ATCC 29413]MBD2381887.1 peptidoglycan-binding protein [Trichormus variabilis FACHB-319]MBC1215642.1 peptidoglycan-binding protein [Trichormus variabilis ARAD]MBC1257399.1 peptidoglycan-binding protein [Trichormus variabilis V5]MBC1266722.1 peptidoglycan-binding protein [Trichormus variabilis FSR]
MKGCLRATISYLKPQKAFCYFSTSKFYWLLMLSSTTMFVDSLAVVAIATPQQIAQQVVINRPTLKIGSQGERVSELQAALRLLGFYSGAIDGVYNENTANAVSGFKQAAGLTPDGIVDAITWQRLFPSQAIGTPVTSVPNSTPNPPASSTTGFPVPTQPVTTPTVNPRPTTPNPPANTRPEPRLANPRPTPPRPTTPTPRQQTPQRPSSTPRFAPTPSAQRISGIQYTSEGWPILRVGMKNSEVTKLQQRLSQLGFLKGGVDGYFGVQTEEALKAAQRRYGIEPDGVAGGATWEALLRRSSSQGR